MQIQSPQTKLLALLLILSCAFTSSAFARKQFTQTRTTGVATVLLKVDYKTGRVKKFKMLQGTGDAELDRAAETSLRRRVYPACTVRKPIRTQMQFTLTRKSKWLPVRKALPPDKVAAR